MLNTYLNSAYRIRDFPSNCWDFVSNLKILLKNVFKLYVQLCSFGGIALRVLAGISWEACQLLLLMR